MNITARGVFGIELRPVLTPLSDITASSEQGVSGIVAVNALDTSFIQGTLAELSDQFFDSDALVANTCVAQAQDTTSTFTLTTGNTLADSPGDSLSSTYSTGAVQTPAQIAPISQPGDNIQEPSGIYQLADGRLIMGQECS